MLEKPSPLHKVSNKILSQINTLINSRYYGGRWFEKNTHKI